jgi:hypothetical protein
VELLKRVIGQHDGADLVGYPEQESISPADGARRWGNDVPVIFCFFEARPLLHRDAVAERSVDDNGDNVIGVLGQELPDGYVKLVKTG